LSLVFAVCKHAQLYHRPICFQVSLVVLDILLSNRYYLVALKSMLLSVTCKYLHWC